MTKVIAQNSLGRGARQVFIKANDGKVYEIYLKRGEKIENADWKLAQPQDPANFGDAMYHQGQGWLFVGYCVLMVPFFLIGYLLLTGRIQWQTVEFISQICGLPVVLFFVIGMPIIVAIKKRNENPYQ